MHAVPVLMVYDVIGTCLYRLVDGGGSFFTPKLTAFADVQNVAVTKWNICYKKKRKLQHSSVMSRCEQFLPFPAGWTPEPKNASHGELASRTSINYEVQEAHTTCKVRVFALQEWLGKVKCV